MILGFKTSPKAVNVSRELAVTEGRIVGEGELKMESVYDNN